MELNAISSLVFFIGESIKDCNSVFFIDYLIKTSLLVGGPSRHHVFGVEDG